ncbi:hypothetical protein, partial [Rhizobium ruizarguesonis]|uniref:hypothetical protein n=1 Tax=Rhizobium ruizarguesonis TaxID=2081791 RepID=UPI001FE22D52
MLLHPQKCRPITCRRNAGLTTNVNGRGLRNKTMTTYYVATTSSGGGNGSASSPFHTISEAMAANLRPGDEVVVKPG